MRQDLSKETCRTAATRDSLPALLAVVGDAHRARVRVDDCSGNIAELVRLGCCCDDACWNMMMRLLLCVRKQSRSGGGGRRFEGRGWSGGGCGCGCGCDDRVLGRLVEESGSRQEI